MQYYVNDTAQPSGEHEVHKSMCAYLPSPVNLRYLGDFADCVAALAAARLYYTQVDGCGHCSPACHRR